MPLGTNGPKDPNALVTQVPDYIATHAIPLRNVLPMSSGKIHSTHNNISIFMWHILRRRQIPHKLRTDIFTAYFNGHIPVVLRRQPYP
jgi:hypothetical protein